MLIQLKIYSKNEKSLSNFLFYINKLLKSEFRLNIIILNVKSKKLKKNRISVLKSPHVNKTAQESFESNLNKKTITLFLLQHNLFLIILKKLQETLFLDIYLVIECIYDKSKNLKFYKHFYVNNKFLSTSKRLLLNLDVRGEVMLKLKNTF